METNQYLLAKVEDKISLANQKNKIMHTAFYTPTEIVQVEKHLKFQKYHRYIWNGGFDSSERKLLIIYPEKLSEEIVQKNITNIMKAIHIQLPRELLGKYTHRDYLGVAMQLGLERERFGDIIVFEEEAFFIVLAENAEYICENLKHMTRFKKASVEINELSNIKIKPMVFEKMKIVVSSERVDNFVSEICHLSRSHAENLILGEKVLINHVIELKPSKSIKVGDILTIRTKGKFVIDEYVGLNKKGKKIYYVQKYV